MPPFNIVHERPKATGEFLFTRYPSEAIILLSEDDTLSFTNTIKKFTLKVVNGKIKLI